MKIFLKGSALHYVLMLSLLFSVLLGSFLSLNYLLSQQIQTRSDLHQAEENMWAGVEIFLSNPFWEGEKLIPLYDRPLDHCTIGAEPWGLWGLVHSAGVHGNVVFEASHFVGIRQGHMERVALCLQEGNQALLLSGQCFLGGDVYVSPAGVQPAVVQSLGFQGDKLVHGQILPRDQFVPSFSLHRFLSLTQSLSERSQIQSISDYNSPSKTRKAIWAEPAKVIESTESLRLQERHWQGKWVFRSEKEIWVSNRAKLEHCILIAPEIHIETGFNGILQAFASRKIMLEEGVHLGYPSCLVLLSEPAESSQVLLEKYALVEGAIIHINESVNAGSEASEDLCMISKQAEIWGLLHSNQYVDLRGSIFGRLFCQSIKRVEPLGSIPNLLVDATIAPAVLDSSFLAPICYTNGKHEILQSFFYETEMDSSKRK